MLCGDLDVVRGFFGDSFLELCGEKMLCVDFDVVRGDVGAWFLMLCGDLDVVRGFVGDSLLIPCGDLDVVLLPLLLPFLGLTASSAGSLSFS